MTKEELVRLAKEGMQNAYTPYSDFQVGAAVETIDGTVFTGCNIENASYGATICAERVAMVQAIAKGYREFKAIAIVSKTKKETFSCGICRQFMAEFMPKGIVYLEDEGHITKYTVEELLPHSFELEK